MKQVFIGKQSNRVFNLQDHDTIMTDYQQCVETFIMLGINDVQNDNDEQHPLFNYYQIVKWMKISSNHLIKLHNTIIMNRINNDASFQNNIQSIKQEKEEEKKIHQITDVVNELTKKPTYNNTPIRNEHSISKKYYDHDILYILARRKDETAQTYVQHLNENDSNINDYFVSNTIKTKK